MQVSKECPSRSLGVGDITGVTGQIIPPAQFIHGVKLA